MSIEWNLPPGCRPSDIDARFDDSYERYWEQVDEDIPTHIEDLISNYPEANEIYENFIQSGYDSKQPPWETAYEIEQEIEDEKEFWI